MKNKIRNICDLFIGLLCVCSVIAGYYKDVRFMGEYCFISGILTGAFFFFSFIYGSRTKKHLPVMPYFVCMITLAVILIATLAMVLNLQGAFWFIHIINPVIVFLYWCIFCDHLEVSRGVTVAAVVIFPMCYMLFAFALWKAAGISSFPASMIFKIKNTWYALLGIVAMGTVFLALGYALHFLNRFFHQRAK